MFALSLLRAALREFRVWLEERPQKRSESDPPAVAAAAARPLDALLHEEHAAVAVESARNDEHPYSY